jgi:hypothetical protein
MSAEIVITSEGRMYRETVTREEIRSAEGVLNRISATSDRIFKMVFDLPKLGPCNLLQSQGQIYVTAPLGEIPLKCPFHMNAASKVLVPNLSNEGDPVLPLSWKIPGDMAAWWLFAIIYRPDYGDVVLENTWLFCRDNSSYWYRLPLGNLYDDCRVCTGVDRYAAPTVRQAVVKCLDQIERSTWNADLWKTVAETQRLFRFSSNNETFKQLAPEGTWQTLCRKVSVAVTSKLVL